MNNQVNLVRLRMVASSLTELNEKVVFVGGATVGLYADNAAAEESRPTDDIDIVIEVATYAEFSSIVGQRLQQLGFRNDHESSVICRYKIHGLSVDIMPVNPDVLGFSNRWYEKGVAESVHYQLDKQQVIRIFSAPYFLASKVEAYSSFRHGSDPRTNSDFEDIIYVFDNRDELLNEIIKSPEPVRLYLKTVINELLSSPTVYENIYSHLERKTASQRTQRILGIWQAIVGKTDALQD